ncbi:hypothetical protein HOLleu_00388 [Holothuria leucospilota]|uniref:Uncharacterized protein n=1 Tax=Holothuria leucospilota TaxID=206669 RepID=A0A9Q1CNJ5_HOLLE|nr:hypothetical protein HOLleu_00388 [Holothuria leucospilota]
MASVRFVCFVLLVLTAATMIAMVNAACNPGSMSFTSVRGGTACKECVCNSDGDYECQVVEGAC